MALLVKGGKIASSTGLVEADLCVGDNGSIEKVGKGLSLSSHDSIVDASGLWILPGAIDGHVHFRQPGGTHKEDMSSGSAAALSGGVTTILDMPNTSPPTSTPQAYAAKLEMAKGTMRCDWGLYYGATSTNALEAAGSGAVALKAYVGSTTGDLMVEDSPSILQHFSNFPRTIAVHAEDNSLINHFATQFPPRAENHGNIRAPLVEQVGVSKVLALAAATKARVHIAHITTPGALDLVHAARQRGLSVTCEVTPHHLFLDNGVIPRLGNRAKMNPPLRSSADVAGLWDRIGMVDCIASDHAPHTIEEKAKLYSDAPSGVPGVETMLPLMFDAVLNGRLALHDAVRLCSEGPARVFGLSSKGRLATGYDGDFVLFDPKGSTSITSDSLRTRCKWSPFEGAALKGRVESVYLRGQLAFQQGSVLAKEGWGKHVVTSK